MKFLNPENLAEALQELSPIEQILYCDALLCTRLLNTDDDDDEMADSIRDMMDAPYYKLAKEERDRLNKFFEKVGEARYE